MIEIIVGILVLSIIPIVGIIVNLLEHGKDIMCWDSILGTGFEVTVFLVLLLLFAYLVGSLIIHGNVN